MCLTATCLVVDTARYRNILNMDNSSAIVVFSGGQDSTTCLFWAMSEFDHVEAITFDYGQRHAKEIDCARAICRDLGVEHTVLEMEQLGRVAPSSLTRDNVAVDKAMPDDHTPPNSYVDGRNMVFLTFAAIVAKQKGIHNIVTGVCETDFSGYPDCRDIFIKSLNVSLDLAMDYTFVLHTPLMWLDKAQTWALADSLGRLDYVRENTLTCYNGIKGDGCGDCPACKLRKRGLDKYIASKNQTKQ